MSWSVSAIGTRNALLQHLEHCNDNLTDQSREEWEEVKPILIRHVESTEPGEQLISLSAHGSAYVPGASFTISIDMHALSYLVKEKPVDGKPENK